MAYSDRTRLPGSVSVVLCDVEIATIIDKLELGGGISWASAPVINSVTYSNTYYIGTLITVHNYRRIVKKVVVNGRRYVKLNSVAAVNAQPRSWYHDPILGTIYVRPHTGVTLDASNTIVWFELNYGTHAKFLNGKCYLPYLLTEGKSFGRKIEITDPFFGWASMDDGGEVAFNNAGSTAQGNFDDLLSLYKWHGTVTLYHGIDTVYSDAAWSDYQKVQSSIITEVERTDLAVILKLGNPVLLAKAKAHQVHYDDTALTDEEDYHDQTEYTEIGSERGKPQEIVYGSIDNTGSTFVKWENAAACTLVDPGTAGTGGNVGTKWKVMARLKDHESTSYHGGAINAVLHRQGQAISIIDSSRYTTTGDENTLIQFKTSGAGANYAIDLDTSFIRAIVDGMKDKSGKFTGSGTSIIQKPQDVIMSLLIKLGGYNYDQLDIASMTAGGSSPVSKTVTVDGVSTVYVGTLPIDTDPMKDYYGNVLMRCKDLSGNVNVEDLVSMLAKSIRCVVVPNNDGQLTLVHLDPEADSTDAFIDADTTIGWREWMSEELLVNRVVVEYAQIMHTESANPEPTHPDQQRKIHPAQNTGTFLKVASKKTTAASDGTDVRNNYALSFVGKREDVIIRTALKSRANAKAIANAWKTTYGKPIVMIEFTDITGTLMQVYPGQRLVVKRSRAIGNSTRSGSINEKVFWVISIDRNYGEGTVVITAMEAR